MPYTPTAWTELGDDLQRLFLEIVCSDNGNTSRILKEAINLQGTPRMTSATFYTHCRNNHIVGSGRFIKSCWDFAKYQHDLCVENNTTLAAEGFQIGSPWHGDILQAPVLFLSINPGLTHRCYFPRWDYNTNTFTLNGTPINEQGMYDFLTTRLQDGQHFDTVRGNPNALVIGRAGLAFKPGGVPYWEKMLDAVDILLGHPNAAAGNTMNVHMSKLARCVLSTEIMFWGSQRVDGAWPQTQLNYYWDRFALPLLEKCGAKILVLVGRSAINAFNSSFSRNDDEANPHISSGDIYPHLYMGKFRVAAINHFSYHYVRGGIPPQNYPAVIAQLKAEAIANPGGITDQAIQETVALYHQ